MKHSDAPLITHLYTADPSARVFEGKLYVYPSHDRETDQPDNDLGDQYDMVDYHVFSMDDARGPVTDHGVALTLADVPWAAKQLWAPDAATSNGRYYLYFPARDHAGVFHIGVAVGEHPAGPFKAEPAPIPGSFSIDPCAFTDTDGRAYLYFGGLWGGQLQNWCGPRFDPAGREPVGAEPALCPRVAALAPDMKSFAGPVHELRILDEHGAPLRADDHERRFFEAAWMHHRDGVYYFSYSTGNTHFLAYATADNPLGPFTYAGRLLEPVVGWTTHHSIVEFKGRWYLFHHDSTLSGGVNHLRCVKIKELVYDEAGRIKVLSPSTTASQD
ncbi:MAG: glycoside hydrolase family 43 protein [Burkholderiales bacterium]|nr:glycoside hydrolase family 43 protein [Opitutaceae bacterium]